MLLMGATSSTLSFFNFLSLQRSCVRSCILLVWLGPLEGC